MLQGSILGPLMFIIYMNDLIPELTSEVRLYADDVSIFQEVEDRKLAISKMNENLETVSNWAELWHVKFIPNKTKSLLYDWS